MKEWNITYIVNGDLNNKHEFIGITGKDKKEVENNFYEIFNPAYCDILEIEEI